MKQFKGEVISTMDRIFLVDASKLKRESGIDDNVNENILRSAIEFIQDTVIERVLGTCITNEIKNLICSGYLCESECYNELLNTYIFPIFIYGVQAEISIPLSYKQRNAGTVKTYDTNIDNAALSEIKYLNQYYKNRMDFYVQRAIEYLCCNRDCFNLCCKCGCGCCSTLAGSKLPSVPINLVNIKTKGNKNWRR